MASAHHAVRLEREGAPSDLEGRAIRGGGRASVEDGKVQGRGFGHDDRFLSGGGADRWIKLIGRGGQRRALASPSAYRSRYEGLRWLGLLERVAPAHATPLGGLGVAGRAQYSSARMIVRTRVVTAGSAASGEPNSVARSK